ncbi:MAG: putative glycoside hydrolase [Candidatus Paceibacterota bacterium]|jgi:hypothetical protein
MKRIFKGKHFFVGASLGVFAVAGYLGLSFIPGETYSSEGGLEALATSSADKIVEVKNTDGKSANFQAVAHMETPEPLKAIYMTACVAGTPSWRERMAKLVETTELNSIIIDIKDYSGAISIETNNPIFKDNVGKGCRVKDMREFVSFLHDKGIYVIGRITVFQDPYYTKAHPELAVKKMSNKEVVWKDRKGLSFIDVGAKPYWDYIVELGKESYDMGFDELNFDYIRFPSDGDMRDIYFSYGVGKTKAEALEEFFIYLNDQLKPIGAVLSADLFGMTATNNDDLNIGQVLERALPHFDYVSPMVYPSHYPTGFNGWKNVNAHPYDIVKFSLARAVERTEATTTAVNFLGAAIISSGTTTKSVIYAKEPYPRGKIRPWLQDFSYPVTYTPEMVKAQIQATYDVGLTSWMLWDPANKYTPSILLKE